MNKSMEKLLESDLGLSNEQFSYEKKMLKKRHSVAKKHRDIYNEIEFNAHKEESLQL